MHSNLTIPDGYQLPQLSDVTLVLAPPSRPYGLPETRAIEHAKIFHSRCLRNNSFLLYLIYRHYYGYYSFITTATTPAMARVSELTPAIRERICELHAIGWGYKRIHRRYPSIPLSTIRYTIKKEHERHDGVSKPRSGRPKKITEAEKDAILDVIHGNTKTQYKDLLAKVDYKVKRRSIQRLLDAENMRK